MVFMPWVSAALMYRGAQYGQYLTPKFCTSATAASAAFGLDGPLEFIGSAQAHGARLWIAPLPTS